MIKASLASSSSSVDGNGQMTMSDCSRPITAPVVVAAGGDGSRKSNNLDDNLFFSTFGSHIAARALGCPSSDARATTAPVVGTHLSSSYSSNISGGGFGEARNVRVIARVRPLSTKELAESNSDSIIADVERTTIRVVGDSSSDTDMPSSDKRKFEFDAVFGPASTQAQVYEACGDMISTSIFRGYNATILAYGQTGSGKTFTMGTDGIGRAGATKGGSTDIPESSGVIARAVHDLFQMKESLPNGAKRVKVTMSYLEIYNEQAIDLLNDDPTSANVLQVRDSKIDGVIIPNLKHFPVSCDVDVLALMEKAATKRATGSTHMNSVSSRSHAICTLNVIIAPNDIVDKTVEEEIDNDGETSPRSTTSLASNNQVALKAKLTLVDLAGSERIKRTGAEGARMKEGININKELFVLAQVVSALSELGQRNQALGGGQQSHIPYRDSKLTRLLQDSLGGNSRTVMIACISPAESNIEESINTLRYAERTRNIKNSAKINAVSDRSSAGEAAALRKENQQLKLDLARMKSRMMMPQSMRGMDVINSRSGFSMGGLIAFGDMESSLQLQAQCSSLHAENELLKAHSQSHAEEILEASLRADRWQTKAEAITQLAQLHEIDISSVDQMASSTDNLINQLRNDLAERKAELLEARIEAAVARATAGAIINSRGDLNSIVDIVVDGDDGLAPDEDNAELSQNVELTTELSAVSATIQQKEAMVLQMNKERACMDSIHPHYENLLKQLLTDVDVLTIERNDLLSKLSSDEIDTNATNNRRKESDPPMTKRLREQIGKLEMRIEELKLKTKEHERSMKMKDEAEKKCARLLDEITEDKRRRADLQRKLKEASVEMRAEKKAAQQKAAKFLKDSQRLKVELTKMKSVADKQAAVLKRKLDQASAKEKARLDQERKLRSAENMRLASSLSGNSDISEVRKVELSDWVDNEFEYSLIKSDVEDQRGRLENAVSDRSKLMASSDDNVCVEELEEMDGSIRGLRVNLQELEMTVKKAFPAAGENAVSHFRFLDTTKFKGLSKHDAKFVLSHIFDKCLSVKQQLATALSNQEAVYSTSIVSALAKEQQAREKETTTMMMEHAAATLNLLQSTQDAVNSHIEMSINSAGVGDELKEQLKGILGAYHDTWFSAIEALKSNLIELKDTHNDHETMIDNLTKGIKVAPMKAKTKKRNSAERGYDSEAFESEVSFLEEGDGEDSEYEPTPAKSKKQKRRSPRFVTKKAAAVPESPGSPIGATFVDDIDSMNVGTLKKACKKLGVPVAGKKAVLMQRVRDHVFSAPVNPTDRGSKKVNFDCDVATDAELLKSTGDEELDTSECITKNLWGELNSHVSDETSQSSAKSDVQSKRGMSDEKENGSSSMTPGKKAKPHGFGIASPRKLSPNNNPGHLKQTVATSKKRLVPDSKQSLDVTTRNMAAITKKRIKRGMNDAVARALEQGSDLL